MTNKNPYKTYQDGRRYRPQCSGFRVFPDGRKCLGCSDCNSLTSNKMATKKTAKSSKKRATPKQAAARKKFAANAKKASAMVKSGKAKTMKSAWKKIKK